MHRTWTSGTGPSIWRSMSQIKLERVQEQHMTTTNLNYIQTPSSYESTSYFSLLYVHRIPRGYLGVEFAVNVKLRNAI